MFSGLLAFVQDPVVAKRVRGRAGDAIRWPVGIGSL